jgi:hypothetical protein
VQVSWIDFRGSQKASRFDYDNQQSAGEETINFGGNGQQCNVIFDVVHGTSLRLVASAVEYRGRIVAWHGSDQQAKAVDGGSVVSNT